MLCNQLKEINPSGEAIFIQKDISTMRSVDEICEDLKRREPKINCLFLTAGYMSLQGRKSTAEGIDRKMSVNYYSRIRWMFNMMPTLEKASQDGELARVITVLAAGSEGDVRLDDLDLKHNFTLHACLAHCVMLTDFMIEQLAQRHPDVSFSHSYPGTVKTGIANQLTGPVRLAVKVLYAVMTPWIINVKESGERHFFQITNECYPPRSHKSSCGVPAPEEALPMKGMDGQEGSGGEWRPSLMFTAISANHTIAYLLDWDVSAYTRIRI
jgi:NAD(P)-dependent dehydrogenase (short-subunit alcohol dehydrogenase family)